MTEQTARLIIEADETSIPANGEPILRIRDAYSGRGMFGESTFAVVGLYEDLEDVLRLLSMNLADFRIDQMGRDDYIIY